MSASRLVRFATAVGLGLGALWAPAGASASCVLLPDGEELWRTADAVFVGTVVDVDNNARWAKVTVDEVWTGPDQPAEVVVRGGPADQGTSTSVDRTYLVGARYLFAVLVVDGNLEDNACSGTTQVDAIDLDAMRPDDVRAPNGGPLDAGESSGGFDLGSLTGPVLLASVIGGLLLATVLLARRREA
jgi:hypothetical protein